jgi:hypothetical protein
MDGQALSVVGNEEDGHFVVLSRHDSECRFKMLRS